jgi:hypothetical protein
MMNPRAQVLAFSLLMCSAAHAQMQPRPAVVELFTSQGCNSCPPAEAYIGELTQRKDVLALSFHVDYWDDQGWKDPFSLRVSTARQSVYSTARGRASVYTPQVVIDGEDDFVGTDRRRIGQSLAAPRSGVPVGISLQEGDVVVDLGARANIVPSEVLMILYLRKATTPVGRGENAGRKLEEFNIVRGIRDLGQWKGDAVSYRTSRSSLPRDATDVAILVQSTSQHRVIGADTRALYAEQSAH